AGESLALGLLGGRGAVGVDVVVSKAIYYAPSGALRQRVLEGMDEASAEWPCTNSSIRFWALRRRTMMKIRAAMNLGARTGRHSTTVSGIGRRGGRFSAGRLANSGYAPGSA